MILREVPTAEIRRRLSSDGLCLRTGPFVVSIRTSITPLAEAITTLYRDFPVFPDSPFADFHVAIEPRKGWRRWVRAQAVLTAGTSFTHDPFDRSLSTAFFEWGLNRCISLMANQYLILHGAVVERDGQTTVLLGRSGSGKSTLCAALTVSGWRLLSDELTLIVPHASSVLPLARPISLKNESIGLIRACAPDARFGPRNVTTRRGVIAHLRPPRESVERMHEPGRLSRFIFVTYDPQTSMAWRRLPRSAALLAIAHQSFNYGTRGRSGFDHLTSLVDEHPTSSLRYSNLHDAVSLLDSDAIPNAC